MELAKTAHDRFTYAPSTGGQKRMYWKMSIDLSYPLVHSMGHHDPLDGFITYAQLQDTANRAFQKAPPCDLRAEIADMARICRGKTWATDDTLGIGGLLSDAHRVAQLMSTGSLKETGLLGSILGHALSGLKSVDRNNPMNLPADYRLAFRELGLSIGLKALKRLETLTEEHPAVFEKESLVHSQIETLLSYARLGDAIEGFWLDRDNQRASSWMEHRDINMVMLATSLTPDGYLAL
jgi:hypothetical protein